MFGMTGNGSSVGRRSARILSGSSDLNKKGRFQDRPRVNAPRPLPAQPAEDQLNTRTFRTRP